MCNKNDYFYNCIDINISMKPLSSHLLTAVFNTIYSIEIVEEVFLDYNPDCDFFKKSILSCVKKQNLFNQPCPVRIRKKSRPRPCTVFKTSAQLFLLQTFSASE